MKGINCALCVVLSLVLIFLASCESDSRSVQQLQTSKLFDQVVGETGWIRFKAMPPTYETFEQNAFSKDRISEPTLSLYGEILAVDNGWLWLEETPTKSGIFNKHVIKHLIALDDIAAIRIE